MIDVAAYFARDRCSNPANPAVENVRLLHRGHVFSLPFGNLDMALGALDHSSARADAEQSYQPSSRRIQNLALAAGVVREGRGARFVYVSHRHEKKSLD